MAEKFHLTKEAIKELEKEYQELKRAKHFKVNSRDDVPEVFHSEEMNPEYAQFQEDLDKIESRIIEIEYILKNVKPIKPQKGVVDVGTVVTVDINGKEQEFAIVEKFEANPEEGKISKESPVGKILLGSKIGDEISVSTSTKSKYKIKKIDYLSA
ncbi:MAG: Transcription elongation factor GreA [Parcubacteria group bacterium ADurb.Bin247]|jgi:transcription elongation factor GreA|nr:MAG: Transcription elongation factor GreA [Parcubacteria group bacterium ADurb.Bin247]HQB85209.1 GreA/GreB family elongation factor [Candidatus Pacearchaeota archaeon]